MLPASATDHEFHAQIRHRLANVVKERRNEHRIAVSCGVLQLVFGTRAHRQPPCIAEMQRVLRDLEPMNQQTTRLGVVMRFGRGQQLHEFHKMLQQRLDVSAKAHGRESKTVAAPAAGLGTLAGATGTVQHTVDAVLNLTDSELFCRNSEIESAKVSG
jgi:hypothetical protein